MVNVITPLTRKRPEYYSDLHKTLAINPVSNDLAKKIDEESVKESIKNLILTDRGERLFQPNLGCNVRRLLFDNYTPQTRLLIESAIRDTIEFYEPRCILIGIDVISKPDDNNITISVIFALANLPGEITLSIVLERTR
jgi:phage baseplate assembly protein W